jgi:hypothetical protein
VREESVPEGSDATLLTAIASNAVFNIGDGLFQLDAPNLYVAMTRGSKLLVLCSNTMLLNPRRK